MVMGGDQSLKDVGSNPNSEYWINVFSFFHLVKNFNVCLKRRKQTEKRLG